MRALYPLRATSYLVLWVISFRRALHPLRASSTWAAGPHWPLSFQHMGTSPSLVPLLSTWARPLSPLLLGTPPTEHVVWFRSADPASEPTAMTASSVEAALRRSRHPGRRSDVARLPSPTPPAPSPSPPKRPFEDAPAAGLVPPPPRLRKLARFSHLGSTFSSGAHPTDAAQVLLACQRIVARDPRVCGKLAVNVTSAVKDAVLRRWEMTKLVALLPAETLQELSGLSPAVFRTRAAADIAEYLFAKAQAVEASTLRQARYALQRLLDYMTARDIPWDGPFGSLCELDLFSFLIAVHNNAVAHGTDGRPGFSAAWGVLAGLSYLSGHFKLPFPIAAVRAALPKRGTRRGANAILTGARPLPPEALQEVFRYIRDPATPPVMRSWAFALAFSAVSSLRQINAQHLVFYGEFFVLGKPYLISQHTDGKSRDRSPRLFITPLEDMDGSREWFDLGRQGLWADGDFMWAESSGDPLSHSSRPLRCPLSEHGIQKAFKLVLQQACSMASWEVAGYTKHSARKLMVSVAQAAGVPWEQCIELGQWAAASLDKSFLLPAEDTRRKRALECMAMPKRYSANARLARVARIKGNQISRMRSYLLARRSLRSGPRHATAWDQMPSYIAAFEGA